MSTDFLGAGAARLAIAVCFAATSCAADRMPLSCGAVGAQSYTPPSVTIPAVVLNRGTLITVTNATVALNGDTSSVAALVANPGPDGISIQEAIMATNNDPGIWNIQFAPALKGSTIVVDSGGLAFLTSGNVTINGDIDGDGQPDITLTSMSDTFAGVTVLSGGNTLYALALQNFSVGVLVREPSTANGLPAVTGTIFSNITISNLVMMDIQMDGIAVSPVGGGGTPTSPSVVARNTWDHLLITGNTISGSVSGPGSGIVLDLIGTADDTLQHTTVANNNIVVPMPGARGISMEIGSSPGSNNNQALDTLIANNSIAAALPQMAIRIAGGENAGSGNLIDGMQMIANQISITRTILAVTDTFPTVEGIALANGDAASDYLFPTLLPIQYSENNIFRNIGILSNTIAGTANIGIFVQVACCGNTDNTISGLSILGNTLTGIYGNGVLLGDGSSGGYYSRPTAANELSNVLVQSNSIQVTSLFYSGCNCYPPGAGISFGGIEVWAGWAEPGNSVNGISIANNEVDTPLVGIGIIGGFGGGGGENAPVSPADNNVVSALQILCNQVDQLPTLGLDYPGIKGINVTGGLLDANGNQIRLVRVEDNLIGGTLGDASFFTNLGDGASGNTISITPGGNRREHP